MKRILIPTDFSANANNAAKAALLLAKKSNAELHFYHAVFTPTDWSKMTDDMRSNYPESAKKVDDAQRQMDMLISDPMFKGVNVKATMAYGNVTDELTKFLAKNEVDIIVVGSHGTAHKADLFIGSTTQRIMRTTNIPVMAVKDSYDLSSIKKIAFASNLDKDAYEPFKKIDKLCKELDIELELLYINTPHNFKNTDEIDELVMKFQKAVNTDKKVVVRNDYEVSYGILEYCKQHKSDIATLVNHRKAYKAAYLVGVTETLVFQADFPVVSVNVS